MGCHVYRFLLVALVASVVVAYGNYGDCREPQQDDELIWEYEIRRSYKLGAYQEAISDYGPTRATITCVKIESLSDGDEGDAWITAGGVGKNFVRLQFRTKYSRGLRAKVFVYGRTT